MPEEVKITLNDKEETGPKLEEFQIYQRIRNSKKPNSTVIGDVPVKVIKEFTVEYAKPVTHIFNKITETGIYPRRWVVETQFPLKKEPNPRDPESLQLFRRLLSSQRSMNGFSEIGLCRL